MNSSFQVTGNFTTEKDENSFQREKSRWNVAKKLNHFYTSTQHILTPSYSNLWSVIFCLAQTDTQAHRQTDREGKQHMFCSACNKSEKKHYYGDEN